MIRKGGRSVKELLDIYQRPLQDLRISVTDRCNFRCNYCMPAELFPDDYPFLAKEQLLSFAEMIRVVKILQPLGLKKVRITGGEPLLRKDLSLFIKQLQQLAIKDIALTTNGVLLKKYARELKGAGIQRVNISLDAIDEQLFKKMSGRNIAIKKVIEGIEAAQQVELGIKVNMVVRKGWNESQILPMVRFCKEKGIQLRFIEFMDVGSTNGWRMEEVVTSKEIRQMIQQEIKIVPVENTLYGEVAKRYQYEDGTGEIGFISSVTETFCGSCTRARLSADGKIYTCLFANKGYDLRNLLRSGAGDQEVVTYIKNIWNKRDDKYSEERMKHNRKRNKIEMSYIGG